VDGASDELFELLAIEPDDQSRSMLFLTLPSNSSMEYFPNNTLASFTTRLPQMSDLDEPLEIGLAEI
jgi:hypothetical protein